MTFRVSELQLLLGLANQSKCGRKTELLQRALALIERGVSTPVQIKIREIFRKYMPPQRAVLGPGYNASSQQSSYILLCSSTLNLSGSVKLVSFVRFVIYYY